MSKNINCPHCGHAESAITDTRARHRREAVQRSRTCQRCKRKWFTIEIDREQYDALTDEASIENEEDDANTVRPWTKSAAARARARHGQL